TLGGPAEARPQAPRAAVASAPGHDRGDRSTAGGFAMTAIRRLQTLVDEEDAAPQTLRYASLRDLRAVLALAKQAVELKRRVRLARRLLSPLGKRYGEPADV